MVPAENMSITLFGLVKGSTNANVFSVKISRDEPISELKKVIKAGQPQTFTTVFSKYPVTKQVAFVA